MTEIRCVRCGMAVEWEPDVGVWMAPNPGGASLDLCPKGDELDRFHRSPSEAPVQLVETPLPDVDAAEKPVPEIDFRAMLGDDSRRWAVQRQLAETLGRPYLATQLAQMLPPEMGARLVQRIDQLLGPEIERRMSAYVAQLQDDVDRATAETLARLAQAAERKREELHRERFNTPSRLA